MDTPDRRPGLEDACFEPPDDYEDRIEHARELLELWPEDEMYRNDKAVLDMSPSRADIAAANAELEAAQALFAELQRARYEGADPRGASMLTIDVAGQVVGLEFDTGAVRMGNRELSASIKAAWEDAKRLQAEDAERLNGIARRIGG